MQRMVATLLLGLMTYCMQGADKKSSAVQIFGPEFQQLLDARKTAALKLVTGNPPHIRDVIRQCFDAVRDLRLKDAEAHIEELQHTRPAVQYVAAEECVDLLRVADQMGPKYSRIFAETIGSTLPKDAVLFGGTDAGHCLSILQAKALASDSPFITLCQNKLASGYYLYWIRAYFGNRIKLPIDTTKQFQEYVNDARRRKQHDLANPLAPPKVLPGEKIDLDPSTGRTSISGRTAAMTINGKICRVIFDDNPKRDFFVQESHRIDWMTPYLRPHGPVMKLERDPIKMLTDEEINKDREYWNQLTTRFVGDWIGPETSMEQLCEFIVRVHHRKEFDEFTGDREFIRNTGSQAPFGKLRSAIGGLYQQRIGIESPAKGSPERKRLVQEAEHAFRQAVAISPRLPEAVSRYAYLLMGNNRLDEADRLVATALKLSPEAKQLINVRKRLDKRPRAAKRK